jgi:Fe2+ or Zn2+ uptake regulation protein
VNKLASAHDYQLTAHHIELQGICSSCQKEITSSG